MKKNSQLASLMKQFSEGTHAHAYLFFGGSPEEKKEAALACAKSVTGHDTETLNPDVCVVSLQEGSDSISIEQARSIRRFLSFTSYFGKGKAVIIEGIEYMGEAAASTLLKTLEEPPKDSVLILISEQPGTIMPTILSRVQKVRFSEAEGGAIDKKKDMFYALAVCISGNAAERFTFVERIIDDEEDVFPYWISFYRDLLHLTVTGGEEYIENTFYLAELKRVLEKSTYSRSQLANIVSELVRTEYILRTTNVNRRLALEYLILTL